MHHFYRIVCLLKAILFICLQIVYLRNPLCLSGIATATATIPEAASTTYNRSFPITTLINAKWSQTPLYLEIAEFLADENKNSFWYFVNDATNADIASHGSESASYHSAILLAKKYLGDLQMPILKLVVSMHSLTARIQTHLQIAAEIYQRAACPNAKVIVEIDDEFLCNLDDLKKYLLANSQNADDDDDDDDVDAAIELYNFDHVYPGTENFTRTLILYGDLGSNSFASYHNFLASIAVRQRLRYVMRHYMADLDKGNQKLVRLSGYGVELHLKSTEYKSQDDSPKGNDTKTYEDSISILESEVQGFNFTTLKMRYPTLGHSLDKLRENLLRSNDAIAQLKAWEFQDLGLQAAAAVAAINGEESLQILQFITHNFPMQAKTLLNYNVMEELRNEIFYNTEVLSRSLSVDLSDGALFINGIFFDADTMDLYTLVETLRSEVRVLETLYANKLSGALASALLSLDLSGSGARDFAIDIRDTAVTWINDIEKDPQYRRWPSSVTDLLRPTFPGMLRNIRKNVFNLVLIVNPLNPASRNIVKLVESFIIHMAPIRLGLVFDERPFSNKTADDFYALNCAFNYATQTQDSRAALSFLTDIFTRVMSYQHVERKHIRSQLKKTFKLDYDVVDDILGDDSDYDYGRQLAIEFVERLGFPDSPQALLNGVPMAESLLATDSDFEEAIFSEILQQTTTLQKAVFKNELNDNDDIIDYLMNQPHVMPRLNQRILNGNEDSKYLDFTGKPHKDLRNVNSLAELSDRDMTATLLDNLKYFEGRKSADQTVHFLTLWIFGDVEQEDGKLLLANALRYVKSDSTTRIAFIPNTEGGHLARKDNLNRLVWAAMQTLPSIEATDLVLKWLKQTDDKHEIPTALYDILDSTELHIKMLRVYSQKVLGLKAFERLIISNGRIIGPLVLNEKFDMEDFRLLDRFNSIQYGNKLQKVLNSKTIETSPDNTGLTSDVVFKLYACLIGRQSKTRFKIPNDIKDKHSVVKLKPKNTIMPYFDIIAIVDPASKSAQKLSPILLLFRQILNCRMQIFLIPVGQHSDMPITNFYRYVIEPEVQFSHGDILTEGPIAKFTGVPSKSLLTQNLHVPENWLVEVVRSVYDLDNIKLSEIGGPVHSEFELENLLLEGHCFDSATGAPPRGLQITLGTENNPTMVDTIVMANLGYFQLKANPGVWTLRLRDGKSADIYDITSADGPNTFHHNASTQVVITTLRSHVIKLRVTKKSGMQNYDLLGDEDINANKGIWNSITSTFGGGGGSSGSDIDGDDADVINIFSVASGHLYERLLRIMMVSLIKHTKSPVKFWFLKNYLSPQFIDFLPHMAREYNLKYELVQYKWPRWLHQQTEKQRTIWGYKILFLDVLFPLNVRKIIFVDADAIVRADLQELFDMDLEGAPYAYTPFCDSRKEMEGFRFWKQGYWRSHLMGRRYHISALYVVDLKRFRKIAAGDRLRGQYQALTQDPNSLANLDQDLPNNMIHQVAIKSLPDEWLWCQTWCSDSALKIAKVIDLCNNPLTKEAKLTAAQRIVPEWKNYDAEIKALMSRIEDHENIDHHEASVQDKKPINVIDKTNSKNDKHDEL